MPRPGVIVGLGGTGQWVLTWLKRDLLLSNNGVMPHNVKLLAIDTTTQLEAGASRITAKGSKEEAAEVGGVTLDKSEYLYIGGDAYDFAKQIKRRQDEGTEQTCTWFHADEWLRNQPHTTFILDDGAGRLRQFGRLAIFKDLQGGETKSKIWTALRTAIESVRSSITQERSLEIIIVGSFAGGTGSGLFIDVALIARLLADKVLHIPHHILRGMFALPNVFTAAPDAEMKARSFAAWRELNRFMVVDPDFRMPTIQYLPNSPLFRIQPDKRIFDACYLVDGKRGGQPIAQEPKYGVFPMLAEVLSAILDEKAGTAYTQWITVNLASEYSKKSETPMYSAVGAYTVQVPAYFIQEESSHRFGQGLLLKLLEPEKKPSDPKAPLDTTGARRHLALAAPDRNREDRGFAGRTRCLTILQRSSSHKGESIKPTLFHGRIAEIVTEIVDQNKRQSTVELLARGGTGPASWVAYFPDLGDDPQFEAIRRNVNEQMRYNVIQQYRRREGEKAEEARARFRKIPEDLRTRFGGVVSSGEGVEDFHGTCGEALKECERVQLTIFRKMVRLRLLDILNGHSDDAIVAKSGKLGYAWDYFDGLVQELDRFLNFMQDVKKRREEIKPEIKLAGLSKRAQAYLHETTGKKLLWFWEHPRVKSAELEFLRAQQRLMEIRREDLLHFYVVETAREMKAISEEVRDALQRWIWHLASGDTPSQLPGMWEGIRQGLQELYNAHSYDTAASKVQRLVADETVEIKEEDIRQALKLWEWDVNLADHQIDLRARILPQAADEKPVELLDPTQGESPEQRLQMGLQNQQALLGLARRYFKGVAARTTVTEAIKREYPDPRAFVDAIAADSAEPLFEGKEIPPAKRSNIIRVYLEENENDPYFVGANGVEGILRQNNQLNPAKRDDKYAIQVTGSEHKYKLTLVRTDDLYPYNAYKAWDDGLEAYKAHIRQIGGELDPTLLHNFTAEIEAVEIERKLMNEGQAYRSLHPRVVMLLEDRPAFEQFLDLYILGFIKESPPDEIPYRWQLTWQRGGRKQVIWLTEGWTENRTQARPDIFNAMHTYVIMKEDRRKEFNYPIDHEFANIFIRHQKKRLGRQEERKRLQYHLESRRGLVQQLRRKGYEYMGDSPVKVQRQDYADLATVVELILQEHKQQLDEAQRREEEEWEIRREEALRQGGAARQEYEAQKWGVSHPRIVRLLGEGTRPLLQFIYFGMFKMIKGVKRSTVFRWELQWQTKKGKEQTIWLTPPWDERTAKGPKPDVLEAMYGYAVVKRTQETGRSYEIDHDFAQQLIDKKREEIGRDEEIAMLEHTLESGFVAYLRKLGDNPDTPEYIELAEMIERMLDEKIEELKTQETEEEFSPF